MSPGELLTTGQVAALYGVSEQTVRLWIRKQIIGYVMVGPYRLKRIPRAEAERHLVPVDGAAEKADQNGPSS
jgi:excisionase family DNA binding protein